MIIICIFASINNKQAIYIHESNEIRWDIRRFRQEHFKC